MSIALAGSNWNNTTLAGLTNLNSNNVTSNSNHNIGSHAELRIFLGKNVL